MSIMDLTQVLQHTLSPDSNAREAAQKYLEQASQENLPVYMLTLAQELGNEERDDMVRQAAGIALKNCLTSKDEILKQQLHQRWLAVDGNIREQIKASLLNTLNSNKHMSGATAAQAIASIASAELPNNQWPQLIPQLLENATRPESSERLKQATLESIGYVCEEIKPSILQACSNQILTAVVQGARKEEPSMTVRHAAIVALQNSLEFVKSNFEKEAERNFIMQVVCEATVCQELKVKKAAFECLVKIMHLYYHYMEFYMKSALFALTVEAMKSAEEEVAMQAVEFWSTVCDEEIELAMELAEAQESGHPPQNGSRYYAKGALQYLVPILTDNLAKQSEHDDEETWNIATASSVCLSLLASCCENDIVQYALPFVEKNISNQDWHYREAAVLCFGSILEGPDVMRLAPLVSSALPMFIGLMKDPCVQVRDTAAWTVGRVCDLLPETVLNDQYLIRLVNSLVEGLVDQPRVASNACWAFNTLSEAAYDYAFENDEENEEEVNTYFLSQPFESIVEKLLQTTERADGAESNLRSAAYEALMQMLSNSPLDCYPTVHKTTVVIIERLERTLQMESNIVGADDRMEFNELQSLLCATLQSTLRKIKREHVIEMSDRIMNIFLIMFNSTSGRSGGVQEDALLAVTALINALEGDFIKYMEAFKGILALGLKNHAEFQVCSIAVGVVGDVCRALNIAVLPYCDDFMTQLLSNLANQSLHRSVKPPIISTFGDVALAIGPHFSKYLEVTMHVLKQASTVNISKDNYDMIEYVNQLREGCLEAYTGIIQGLKGNNPDQPAQEIALLQPHVLFILEFIEHITADPDHSDSVIRVAMGVVGDLCSCFGSLMKPILEKPFIAQLLKEGRQSKNSNTRVIGNWAYKEIKKAAK